MWALMRPTARPSRKARRYSRLGVLEERVLGGIELLLQIAQQRRHPAGLVTIEPPRKLDEGVQIAPGCHRADLELPSRRPPYMPTSIDVFAKVRGHEREELMRAAREADLLPYFRTVESPAMPVVEMEGRPRIMLGLQQLPRADRRRARDAGRA